MASLREPLLAGKTAVGVSVMIPSRQIVEMLEHLGFGWALIDCEHGAINLDQVETLATAAAAAGIVPIVRPPTSSPQAITQILDRGVAGVQVPHVGSAAEVRCVVEAARYGSLGSRDLAVGARAARYGLRGSRAEHDDIALVQMQLGQAQPTQLTRSHDRIEQQEEDGLVAGADLGPGIEGAVDGRLSRLRQGSAGSSASS